MSPAVHLQDIVHAQVSWVRRTRHITQRSTANGNNGRQACCQLQPLQSMMSHATKQAYERQQGGCLASRQGAHHSQPTASPHVRTTASQEALPSACWCHARTTASQEALPSACW